MPEFGRLGSPSDWIDGAFIERERTMLFLRERRETVPVTQATILVDATIHFIRALEQLSPRLQGRRNGNRNAVERIFREVTRQTSSFSNTFTNVQLSTAESWLEPVTIRWNQCYR